MLKTLLTEEQTTTPPTPAEGAYVLFSSDATFSLGARKLWDGTMEYSFDSINWVVWTGGEITSNSNNTIYVRGTGNTKVGGEYSYSWQRWYFTTGDNIKCSGNIDNLLDYATVSAGGEPTMAAKAFKHLFYNDVKLISTPTFPKRSALSQSCYEEMFYGCTGLVCPPALPSTNLATYCYSNMFYNCSNLQYAPELPATVVYEGCYQSLFRNTAIRNLPKLPALALQKYCYSYMFAQCSNVYVSSTLTGEYTVPYRIPTSGTGTSVDTDTDGMFNSTQGTYTGSPDVNTTLYSKRKEAYVVFSSDSAFTISTTIKTWDGTIEYSTDLVTWSVWDGTTEITDGVYHRIFLRGTGNTHISSNDSGSVSSPWVISGTNVHCEGSLWPLLDYATSLTGAEPSMGNCCFYRMFEGQAALVVAPDLPSTTLSNNCYNSMFTGSGITQAPDLPALTLTMGCYHQMFAETNIRTPPALLATTLADSCYNAMFKNCTLLTEASDLTTATEMCSQACQDMYYGCTSLEKSPRLFASTLSDSCYRRMFYGCTSLITLANLPALTMQPYCYYEMYALCTAIKASAIQTAEYWLPYIIPSVGTGTAEATGWNSNMLSGTGGTFTGSPEINTTYYLQLTAPTALYFTSPYAFTVKAGTSSGKSWDGTIEISLDNGISWEQWTGNIISVDPGVRLYMRGTGNTYIAASSSSYYYTWTITGTDVSCVGNLETLFDYATVEAGGHPTMYRFGCYHMFEGQTALISAFDMNFDAISYYGCMYMYKNCTNLIQGPSDLPAATLDSYSFSCMFYNCSKLKYAPASIAAATIPGYACSSMFEGCTSLIKPVALYATTISGYACQNMYSGCSSLEYTGPLPATAVGTYGYYRMFGSCTSLRSVPELSANPISSYTYAYMFAACSQIKLSATETEVYTQAYRIPPSGTVSYSSSGLSGMFSGTGGTFTGSPTPHTTYYLYTGAANGFKFSSSKTFTVTPRDGKLWDGTMEYSFDGINDWTVWDGSTLTSGTDNMIFFRGIGNTNISGGGSVSASKPWDIVGGNVFISGNIERLLDYSTVDAGNHPTMGEYCFCRWLLGQTTIFKAPELLSVTLSASCYEQMFYQCVNMNEGPSTLPALSIPQSAYASMFAECSSLQVPPTILATTMTNYSATAMFYNCSSLRKLPKIYVKQDYQEYAFQNMFNGCTKIKLSETSSEEYSYIYCIPTTADAPGASLNALENMFANTGGTWSGSPTINTTYYSSNETI